MSRLVPLVSIITGLLVPVPKSDPRILQNEDIARSMAHRFVSRMQHKRDFDDLYAVALAALWKATQTYQNDRDTEFRTYATTCCYRRLEREQRIVWAKKRRDAVRSFSLTGVDGDDIELLGSHPTPEQAYAALEIAEAVIKAAQPRDRAVVRAVLAGETNDDAGALRGISGERARQLFTNACSKVQRSVESAARRTA